MALSENDQARAKAITDSWFWQVGEGHNFKWSHAVRSMTLFYESAPMSADIAMLVVEYLRSQADLTAFIINGKKWEFTTAWNTKDVLYQTVQSEKWNGTESSKVRIYWIVVQAGDDTADGPYVVENGCKYLVEHSYYWNVSSEPTLPQSSSGVQYSIQGFTRDNETGLYNYVVVKRTTVQQDIPLYESAKTIFETASEEQHLGVKQSDVATTGLQASVGNGVMVERRLTKNPDCTTDIVNRKTEEEKVENARTVERVTLRGTFAATTHRNVKLVDGDDSSSDSESSESSSADPHEMVRPDVGVGETLTVEKTPGGLENVTIENFKKPTLPMTISETCDKQEYLHVDTKTEIVDATTGLPSGHVTAEDNKRIQVSYRLNDDGQTADKTTETQEWSEKTGGGETDTGKVTNSGTSEPVVKTTIVRKENASTEETIAAADQAVNKVVEVENIPNDHGTFSTVKRITEHKTETGDGESRSGSVTINGTATPVVKTTTERQTNATAEETIGQNEGGVNKVVEVENTPNGMGGFNTVKRVTEHKTETGGGESIAGASTEANATVSTTTERQTNATTEKTIGQNEGGVNKVVEVENTPNGMGGFNTVKRTTKFKPVAVTATSNLATETAVTTTTQNDDGQDPAATCGSADASPNDHGSKTTRVTEITPHEIVSAWIEWTSTHDTARATYTYNRGIKLFVNLGPTTTTDNNDQPVTTSVQQRIAAWCAEKAGKQLEVNVHINRYGLYDGSISYTELDSWSETASTDGGISTGTITYKGQSYGAVSYSGAGNEGSERSARANCILVEGMHLPPRTYITSGSQN